MTDEKLTRHEFYEGPSGWAHYGISKQPIVREWHMTRTRLGKWPTSNNDPYMRGREDYPCSIYGNPYDEGTVEFRRWVDGWVQGVIDERDASTVPGSTP